MLFKRKLYTELFTWKNNFQRKPLLLRGARQVGKTSLLKEFGKEVFKQTAYFNFEENPQFRQFFESTLDIPRIIQNLSVVHGSPIHPNETLIIFDEIQECRAALNALKYFHENAPQYHIVGAGSLLGITLGQEGSFPVGQVDFLTLYPLSFEEFLQAFEPTLFEWVNSIHTIEAIPDLFFDRLKEAFKHYFISGGMPEPARLLVETKDIDMVQRQLRNIHEAYAFDFTKHVEKKDIPKIGYIWNSIPSQLSRENKKFMYQAVKTGARARDYEDALLWLTQAGLVTRIYKCTKPNLPLSAYDDLGSFKLYLLDVGLLRSLSQLDPVAFREGNRLFTEFKGALSENFILQSLLTQFDGTPRYWTSDGVAEIDFLIQYKNLLIPVEVKSDEHVRSKSLSYYSLRYQPPIRIRYSLKNLGYEEGLLSIPLFLADKTYRFIENVMGD